MTKWKTEVHRINVGQGDSCIIQVFQDAKYTENTESDL